MIPYISWLYLTLRQENPDCKRLPTFSDNPQEVFDAALKHDVDSLIIGH
jgi:hypothetical protein